MELRSAELTEIQDHLQTKINQAPAFFNSAPLIIDLGELNSSDATKIDFFALSELIREHGMIPVAVRKGSPAHVEAALAANIPALPDRGGDLPADEPKPDVTSEDEKSESTGVDKPVESPRAAPATYRIHDQPVRSGQKVYAKGDLVLLGPVSAGAEVVADGNIHAYGPFRGRALAGASGDEGARIFCHQLEAELVAIAGNYRVIERDDSEIWQRSVQIYLDDNDRLFIGKITR